MQSTPPNSNPSGTNYRATFADLRCQLPPIDASPDVEAERDRRAMDAVVALNPYDAFEARLAARIVAMDAQAADSLRLAGLAVKDAAEMHRCRAQAVSMSRQSDATLRLLRRIQADREKQEAALHPAAMERAGYWFKEIAVPAPAADPAPPADADPFSRLTEAEQYAVMYPDRAARMRAAGGLPAKLDFGPPEPELVRDIVLGSSPIFQALDRERRNGAQEPERVASDETMSLETTL